LLSVPYQQLAGNLRALGEKGVSRPSVSGLHLGRGAVTCPLLTQPVLGWGDPSLKAPGARLSARTHLALPHSGPTALPPHQSQPAAPHTPCSPRPGQEGASLGRRHSTLTPGRFWNSLFNHRG